jgi:hypothetical protein
MYLYFNIQVKIKSITKILNLIKVFFFVKLKYILEKRRICPCDIHKKVDNNEQTRRPFSVINRRPRLSIGICI